MFQLVSSAAIILKCPFYSIQNALLTRSTFGVGNCTHHKKLSILVCTPLNSKSCPNFAMDRLWMLYTKGMSFRMLPKSFIHAVLKTSVPSFWHSAADSVCLKADSNFGRACCRKLRTSRNPDHWSQSTIWKGWVPGRNVSESCCSFRTPTHLAHCSTHNQGKPIDNSYAAALLHISILSQQGRGIDWYMPNKCYDTW